MTRPDIWSAITNAETKRLAELATGRRATGPRLALRPR